MRESAIPIAVEIGKTKPGEPRRKMRLNLTINIGTTHPISETK
jgi:hypothetical protein